MAEQKKGLIARLLEGKEKSEEYARSTLPTNRWQLFWDVFKGNFGKVFKVNLLTLLFFIPLFIVIFMGGIYKDSLGELYPFSANVGIGYPATPNTQGVSEYLTLQSDTMIYGVILLASILAAVGLSGGMYVVRNMIWTEGIFVGSDFWRGVKRNFKNALQTALFFTAILFLCKMMIDFADVTLALGNVSKGKAFLLRLSRGTSGVLIALAAMLSFWMIALGVNYKMGFFRMVRNAFLLTVGTLPQTIFFGLLALLPYLLMLIGWSFLTIVAVFMILLFGVAYVLLVWLDFAQWVFDKYINPKIEGAKVGRGIYSKDGSSTLTGDDSASKVEYQRQLLAYGKSRLVARPIKPIDDSVQLYDLPTSFNREDLQRLKESKQTIIEDTEAYAEEHKNDLRYVEYNRQFAERERALQDEDMKKGGKKNKKFKPPKMLNQ